LDWEWRVFEGPKSLQRHFGALDFYRFVAASGVYALHFSQYGKYDPSVGFGYAVGDFAMFVDFFFILSGFVIGLTYSESVNNAGEILVFLQKRIARIYPMHILTLGIFIIPTILGFSAHPEKWNSYSLISELLLIQSWPVHAPLPYNFVSWSISVEWAMYLLFPAFIWVLRRAGIGGLLAIIVGGYIGVEALLQSGVYNPPLWFMINNPLRAIPSFLIGVVISQRFQRVEIKNGIWIGLASFCLSIFCMIVHAPTAVSIALFSFTVLATARGYVTEPYVPLDNRVTLALGNCSYSLYMLHAIFLGVLLDKLWPKFNLGQVPISVGIIIWLILIAASMLCYHQFEVRMRRWMSPKRLNLHPAARAS
jgi:peptidoglycan/LPS O-acetylase OafA/YrhL